MLQTSKSHRLIQCRSNFNLLKKWFSDNSKNQDGDKNSRPMYIPEEPVSIDNPPTTCCMSGCPNCVYIVWAEALSKKMSNSDPKIAKKILEGVDDPSMKAFLQMELRTLGLL